MDENNVRKSCTNVYFVSWIYWHWKESFRHSILSVSMCEQTFLAHQKRWRKSHSRYRKKNWREIRHCSFKYSSNVEHMNMYIRIKAHSWLSRFKWWHHFYANAVCCDNVIFPLSLANVAPVASADTIWCQQKVRDKQKVCQLLLIA